MPDVKQLSNELGVPETTLRTWVQKFNVSVSRSGNKMKFDEETASMMRVIKQLRDNECGYTTIARKLSNERPTKPDEQAPVSNEQPTQPQPSGLDLQRVINESVTNAVDLAVTRSEGIAEKYARATYRIGELEGENRLYQARIAELTERVKLLEAPKPEPVQEPVKRWWQIW